MLVIPILFTIFFVIFFIVIISTAIIKTSKRYTNHMNDITTKMKNMLQSETDNKKSRTCEYCGSTLTNDQINCPNCGANNDKN